jgi:hypothetical protein
MDYLSFAEYRSIRFYNYTHYFSILSIYGLYKRAYCTVRIYKALKKSILVSEYCCRRRLVHVSLRATSVRKVVVLRRKERLVHGSGSY